MTLDGRRTVSRRNSPPEVSRSRELMAGHRMQRRAISGTDFRATTSSSITSRHNQWAVAA